MASPRSFQYKTIMNTIDSPDCSAKGKAEAFKKYYRKYLEKLAEVAQIHENNGTKEDSKRIKETLFGIQAFLSQLEEIFLEEIHV